MYDYQNIIFIWDTEVKKYFQKNYHGRKKKFIKKIDSALYLSAIISP